MNLMVSNPVGTAVPGPVRYTVGVRDVCPSGTWEVLAIGAGYTLKRIVVSPGHHLSSQYDEHRAEHWTVVQGSAEAKIDGVPHPLEAGEHVYVLLGAHHRIKNAGDTPVVFLEVQVGEHLDEDDIIRLQDDYDRV